MSVSAGTVAVGSDKAYLIVPAFSAQTTGGPNRPGLLTTITNLGSQVIYIGAEPDDDEAMTQAENYQLGVAGGNEAMVTIKLANVDSLWGTAASGTQSVTWLQGWQ